MDGIPATIFNIPRLENTLAIPNQTSNAPGESADPGFLKEIMVVLNNTLSLYGDSSDMRYDIYIS